MKTVSGLASLLFALVSLLPASRAQGAPKGKTLDDLKKLDIICLVPGWLPEGYHLKEVDIDYSDTNGNPDASARTYPGYSLEYGNGKKGSFTMESARVGIGDRNLDGDDRAQESKFDTKLFGTVYIIYFPGGKSGVKKRIVANWVEDANIHAEKVTKPIGPWDKGRYHGISGFGMTISEYEKIVRSLHPIRSDAASASK